ncbi:MAG: hypothetical protein HRU27_17060 [Rhizobiaceae bacterium]|nr:hypothetical protein [Rhizobiaceae bacterium]
MLGAISNTFIFLGILLVLVVLATILLGGKRKPRPRQNIQMPPRSSSAQPAAAAKATAPKAAPKSPAAAKSSGDDDLKRIKGIGPTLEKKLKSQGITKFAQIAKWTEADREKFSELLSFKGRIEREEWVQQAQVLVNET